MSNDLKASDVRKMLDRDNYCCLHCGTTYDTVPQHRLNRGSGGKNRASNVITFCSMYNGEIEWNAAEAEKAREYGWKLRPGQDPTQVPVYNRMAQAWFLLDDDWSRKVVDAPCQGMNQP